MPVQIARKISGYSVKELEKAAGQGAYGLWLRIRETLKVVRADTVKLAKLARLANTTPPLHAVESFIVALTASSDGQSSQLLIAEIHLSCSMRSQTAE